MSAIIEVSDGNFEAEVLQADRPVLVDFSATWCGPCKKLEPVVHEIATDYDGQLKVVRVDVDQAASSAARFAVLSVPTLLVFKGGEVKAQMVGIVSKKAIGDKIAPLL
jgi:thioredoxin 1